MTSLPRPNLEEHALQKLRLQAFDDRLTAWLADRSVPLLRISIGLVFLWFGALKLVPGLSPAEDLATQTITLLSFGLVPPAVSLPVLALWEIAIALGLLSGRFLRLTLLLMLMQMVGTVTPLILFPALTFTLPPIAPTLEGQYILKNAVLVAGALVIGSTLRHNRPHPPAQTDDTQRASAA